MKNRIKDLFETKKENILSVFYTAGFPTLESTQLIAETLAKAGADIIEIGIPYSDPIADGPTIQESNTVALKNGIRLSLILDLVKDIRKTVDIPIILMGYVNPVMQYGIERFAHDAAELLQLRREAVEVMDRARPRHRRDRSDAYVPMGRYDEHCARALERRAEPAPRVGEAIALQGVHGAPVSQERGGLGRRATIVILRAKVWIRRRCVVINDAILHRAHRSESSSGAIDMASSG
jgi:hypothetical protein